MTLTQEAYALIQEQPESNLRIIVDLLKAMSPTAVRAKAKTDLPFKRTGVANGTVVFPEGFDEHFDDLNDEISQMFLGESV